jgi:hypothetical protein
MGRAHDLVVLPPLPLTLLPHAIFVAQLTEATGERLTSPRQIGQPFEKMAHPAILPLRTLD